MIVKKSKVSTGFIEKFDVDTERTDVSGSSFWKLAMLKKVVLQRSTICNLHMNIKSENVWSEIVHVVLNSFSIISCRFARNDELQ